MLVCISCTSDALLRRNPSLCSSAPRFGSEDALTLLRNCSNFKQIKQIHAKIIRNGLSHDHSVVTKLLQLSSAYGRMDYATLIFNRFPSPPPTFTWNVMIRAHTINGSSHQALVLYNLMIFRGVPLDKFTIPFAVKACAASSAIDKGKEVHVLAIKTGLYKDLFVQNTLMDFYLKCGDPDYGCKVFEKMRVRNVVSWTTIITGLVAAGKLDEARVLFEQMPFRNVVSWTTMINGYARNKRPQEAFELFWRMQLDNVRPNEFTLVSLLIACTELGSLKLGRWIHDFALKNGFEVGAYLGTALIDMYSKCGSLKDAKQVFDHMEDKTVATWNSMITSLGVHGCGEEAIALFAKMELTNVQPDAITFVGVLCACVHTNNVSEGHRYFKYMTEHYGITPVAEHYNCLIELQSRANILEEVCRVVDAKCF